MKQEGPTSDVRMYVRDHYVRPAKREQRSTFRVLVGDVHHALKFSNRVPLVCNALSSRKFLEENSVRLIARTGPPSGQSTTVEFTYEFLEASRNGEPLDELRALRGAGKKAFQELGGGENFLREERKNFYRGEGQADKQ